MPKKKLKLNLYEDDVIIIDVDVLPPSGQHGVWYYLTTDQNYYYWNVSSYTNNGGDRPTKPPPIP